MKVPFNDLSRIHKPIKSLVLKKFNKIIDNSDFILNADIKNFEESFSEYTQQNYSISSIK